MAKRYVFLSYGDEVIETLINFKWFGGFSEMQKTRCIESLHDSFTNIFGTDKILEVSSAGDKEGNKFSAYYRIIGKIPVEKIYQASKVFENGKQYTELMTDWRIGNPKEYLRNQNCGKVVSLRYDRVEVPVSEMSIFYNWVYCLSLKDREDLFSILCKYDAFTDYFFNHAHGVSCQARTCAIAKVLYEKGIFDKAIESYDSFKNTTQNIVNKMIV